MNAKTLNTRNGELTLRTARPEDAASLRALRLDGLTTCLTVFGTAPQEIDYLETVVVANEKAIACYRRCGFEITGREVASIRWDGIDYDEHLMSRRVSPEV